MASENKTYTDVATEYGDLNRLAQTAEDMGAHESAQAYRDEASEVRQGLFGSDSQFRR